MCAFYGECCSMSDARLFLIVGWLDGDMNFF